MDNANDCNANLSMFAPLDFSDFYYISEDELKDWDVSSPDKVTDFTKCFIPDDRR